MFERWSTNQNQDDRAESVVPEDAARGTLSPKLSGISRNLSDNDNEKLPFIVHTSEANTRNFARSLGTSRITPSIDNDGTASERPMSPNHAQLRQAEKQHHHGAAIREHKDDVHVQEAILNSLQNETPLRKQESEASDDIAAIVNQYSAQDQLENVEQPTIAEINQGYSSEMREQMSRLTQPRQPTESGAEFEMWRQAAHCLNNYTEFYCDSVPPSGFKAPKSLYPEILIPDIPKSPHHEKPVPDPGLRPKQETYSRPAGILDVKDIPVFRPTKKEQESADGLDELEKLSWLCRDRVAMQKAYNDDMHRNRRSQLLRQGIGFDSEGIESTPSTCGKVNQWSQAVKEKTFLWSKYWIWARQILGGKGALTQEGKKEAPAF